MPADGRDVLANIGDALSDPPQAAITRPDMSPHQRRRLAYATWISLGRRLRGPDTAYGHDNSPMGSLLPG